MTEPTEVDAKAQAEKQLAAAIDGLRSNMPMNFIIVFEAGNGEGLTYNLTSHCTFDAARGMLDYAIQQIGHQFAYQKAVAAVEGKPS